MTTVTTLAAKLIAKPGNKGSGQGYHRDSMYERQIKAFLYLSDVAEENGPFQYMVGTHTKGSVLRTLDLPHIENNLKRFRGPELDDWRHRQRIRLETITGSAGDVILADTRGVHTGIPILSGSRYALTNYYVSAHRYDAFYSLFASYINF
jgi:hypothetical protein